ncbi:MAG: Unknown protein [uncultured Thiotrichaceae bacterium]|uniref:Uncharacterized protein n=1 Tax=uncultured Thiotrichaceae bacterium TaxID=298394 RepID=A0A6S6U556_9GAMM|nr:MAG: Unknown protein [uncultured Thiotrichaceae bacterium]
MKKLILASLLAASAANAEVTLDTNQFTQSLDAMTSTMTQPEQQLFLNTVVYYGMNKSQPHDVTLPVDQLAAKTLNEFHGLTASEILRSIELSKAIKFQQQIMRAKAAHKQ